MREIYIKSKAGLLPIGRRGENLATRVHLSEAPAEGQAEITADTSRASYAIKLMDSTGAILKSEERDLTSIREPAQESAE